MWLRDGMARRARKHRVAASTLALPRPPATPASREKRAADAPPRSELFGALREWRRDTAKEQSIPAFTVLHDTTLDELCSKRPRSLAALLRVHGIGERKAEKYGQEILKILKDFAAR